MKKIKVGIVGCGVIGPVHAAAYARQEGVELAWACDLVKDKASKLAGLFNVPGVTGDFKDVLADRSVDCISICTDHASHVPLAVAALKNGKHVLCEKALASSKAGLDRMMRAHAVNPKLVFGGVFQHRFDPVHRYIRNQIRKGTFGRILTSSTHLWCERSRGYYMADAWRGTWEFEGGAALINQTIHYIDMTAWLVGGVESVCGTYDNLTHGSTIETEDVASASLRFRTGAVGSICATTSTCAKWENVISICGVKGSFELRDGKLKGLTLNDKSLEDDLKAEVESLPPVPPLSYGKSYYGGGHLSQITDFVRAVREKKPLTVTARSARHAVDIVLGVYESSRKGRTVRMPVADRSFA